MSEAAPGPEHLHLTTPAGRLVALSTAMLANLPLWAMLLVVLAITARPDEVLGVGMCLFPVAWVVNAGGSGIAATLWGQVGGNLAIWPTAATLDGRRVMALHDWDLHGPWVAVRTEATDIPQYRFGTPRDVRRALEALRERVPTTTTQDERLDGFTLSCRPGRPHVDLDFAILWSTGVNLLGTVPFAAVVLAASPSMGTVVSLGMAAILALLVALVLASLGAWAVQATRLQPEVTITLRGRTLEIARAGRTDRAQIDDPATQVQLTDTGTGMVLTVRAPDGLRVCNVFVTRPASEALKRGLGALPPTRSGTAAEVPESLGRLRAPEGPGT